jgi:hypothetical protein
MSLKLISLRGTLCSALIGLLLIACNPNSSTSQKPTANQPDRGKDTAYSISHGRYLVTIAGCNDCHSPKKFTPQGPVVDSARLLSGHPAGLPLAPFDIALLAPGHWMLMAPDLTTYVGPWGISYATNLTPDNATGMGGWTEDVFIKTMRTGKHLGLDNGRPILPPMPWDEIAKWNDQDLRSVYRYLHSLPPIRNHVPEPLSPQEAVKLATKK